jgi:hypothetical protein
MKNLLVFLWFVQMLFIFLWPFLPNFFIMLAYISFSSSMCFMSLLGVGEEEDREDEVVVSCTLLPLAMRQK